MGGLVSGTRQASVGHELFVSTELVSGQKLMEENTPLARSFVQYMKSGDWMDRLSVFTIPLDAAETGFPGGQSPSVASSYSLSEKEKRLCARNTLSKPLQGDDDSWPADSTKCSFSELYANLEQECPAFNANQLCCILMSIVYPLYANSAAHRQFIKHGLVYGDFRDDQSSVTSCSVHVAPTKQQSLQSMRAQDILLSCAAHFEETQFLKALSGDWLSVLPCIFQEHLLAFSIVDTTSLEGSIVYANRAFSKLFELPRYCSGRSLDSLNGPDTEEEQKLQLAQAFASTNECCKLKITHYTAAGKKVLDLMAVQRAGRYAMCVHFGLRNGVDTTPLKVCPRFVPVSIILRYTWCAL
jgi:PAS domain-containing protein